MLDEIINEKNNHQKKDPLSLLTLTVSVSIIAGLVSGLAGGYAVFRFGETGKNVSPPPANTGNQGVDGAFIGTTPEEQATVSVVKATSDSVVSIIVKKDLLEFYQSTGAFPFDEFFGFGFPFQRIKPEMKGNPPQRKKQQVGGGSGFVVSSDGMILTNRHVVADKDAEYTVITTDGKEHGVKVLALDPVNDLAILKIDAKNLKALELGDSGVIQIGQTVIAIGNTLGEYRNTVTRGVVSGINRVVQASDANGETEIIQEAIQTDAAINPGNSGGPLLDLSGRVIGVNTAVNQEGQSIGFAIPINVAKRSVESVKKYGKIIRPWLGVRYTLIDAKIKEVNKLPVDVGALIVGNSANKELAVIPGSPADKAGLREGDIITHMNGVKIDVSHSLAGEIAKNAPGDTVKLRVLSKGKEREVSVKLDEFKQ